MNGKLIYILVALAGLSSSCKQTEILEKSILALNSLKTVEFEQKIQLQQKGLKMNRIDSAYCFFDFTSTDSLLGARYQIISNESEDVFDGVQFFSSDNKEKVIYNKTPSMYDVSRSQFLPTSIYVLRKTLPEMFRDRSTIFKRLSDSIINNRRCILYSVEMRNKWINVNSDFSITECKDKTQHYLLGIDRKTCLPTQFKWIFPNNHGYLESTFNSLNTLVSKDDSVWSFDRYPKNYLRLAKKEYGEFLRNKASSNVGLNAPLWTLPMIHGDSINLSGEIGKLILLEFWFPGCQGCVQSIPCINEIQKHYQDKGLHVFGIEYVQDNEKLIEKYIQSHGIEYPILYNGKQIALEYGVKGAPTFVLVDKKGKIIYTKPGLNKEELISEIEKNL